MNFHSQNEKNFFEFPQVFRGSVHQKTRRDKRHWQGWPGASLSLSVAGMRRVCQERLKLSSSKNFKMLPEANESTDRLKSSRRSQMLSKMAQITAQQTVKTADRDTPSLFIFWLPQSSKAHLNLI